MANFKPKIIKKLIKIRLFDNFDYNLCNILIKQFYLKKEAWLSFSDNQIIDLQDIINIDKRTKKRP